MKPNRIRDLNDLRTGNCRGIQKIWIYKSKVDHNRMARYLQKINYAIQDLNGILESEKLYSMKNLIVVICYVDWISDAFERIKKSVLPEVIKDFVFSKKTELQNAKAYLQAVRSYVAAHPLGTDRHKKFGFDGDFICIDVRDYDMTMCFRKDEEYYHINFDGLLQWKNENSDIYLISYSKKKNNDQFASYIGLSFLDIYHAAELYVEAIYELDRFLSKTRKASQRG